MADHRKSFLIFSGSNYRAIVAFCRTLTSLGIDFTIIARTKADMILKTKYRANVSAIRNTHALDRKDIERCINESRSVTNAQEFIICPTSEYLNYYLLRNREMFTSMGCYIPLVDLSLYERVTNKHSFSMLCQEHGILIPNRISDYRKTNFPFVAKPKRNINSHHKSLYPYLIHSPEELIHFEQKEDTADYYYEEYIYGKSYYLLYYMSRDGTVTSFSQQNILQQAGGKSIVLAYSAQIHHQPIMEKFSHMLRSINYYGLVMIEVRIQGDRIIAIELNPRFWGPSQLFVDAGSNIFKAFISDYVTMSPAPINKKGTSQKKVSYLWFNGIIANIRAGKKLKWHIPIPSHPYMFILRHLHRDVYLRPDTLHLFLYEFTQALRK